MAVTHPLQLPHVDKIFTLQNLQKGNEIDCQSLKAKIHSAHNAVVSEVFKRLKGS